VTQERAERKEMEEAFKRQALKVDEVLQQNQELVVRLFNLEKLWVAEEQFTMELRGHVEALQDQVCKCGLSGTKEVPIEVTLPSSWKVQVLTSF